MKQLLNAFALYCSIFAPYSIMAMEKNSENTSFTLNGYVVEHKKIQDTYDGMYHHTEYTVKTPTDESLITVKTTFGNDEESSYTKSLLTAIINGNQAKILDFRIAECELMQLVLDVNAKKNDNDIHEKLGKIEATVDTIKNHTELLAFAAGSATTFLLVYILRDN